MPNVKASPIVPLLYELLRQQHYDNYADLSEDLKCRCARLKIPYDSDLIEAAIVKVEQGGKRRCLQRPVPERKRLIEQPPEPEIIDRADAKRIYDRVLQQPSHVHDMNVTGKTTRRVPVRTLDRLRANRIVWQGILNQIQVCETVEASHLREERTDGGA